MRNGIGSQWRTSRRSGVTWLYFLLLQMSLAAALRTDWRPRSDKSSDSRLRRPKRQRFDVAPDETELTKASADRPRNTAPHGQVGLQQHAEIAHRGRGSYQGPTDTQLSGVKVDTPSAGRTPQEVRLLGVKPKSVGTHPFGHPLNTKLHSTPLLCNC